MVRVGVMVELLMIALCTLRPSFAAPNHDQVTPSIVTSPDQVQGYLDVNLQGVSRASRRTYSFRTCPEVWQIGIRARRVYPCVEVRGTDC